MAPTKLPASPTEANLGPSLPTPPPPQIPSRSTIPLLPTTLSTASLSPPFHTLKKNVIFPWMCLCFATPRTSYLPKSKAWRCEVARCPQRPELLMAFSSRPHPRNQSPGTWKLRAPQRP